MNKRGLRFVLLSSLLSIELLFSIEGLGQYSVINDPEFLKQRTELENRYRDFYDHLQRIEKTNKKRLSGVGEVKRERDRRLKAQEQSRKRFVAERRAAPSTEPMRLRWEAEQKKLAQKREKLRSYYVIRKDELRRLLETSRRIPPETELGLDL